MNLTRAEIVAKLRTILVEQLGCLPESVKPDATFESLGADSLDLVEIIMAVEEEFVIDIDDDSAERLLTVGDAVNLLSTAE